MFEEPTKPVGQVVQQVGLLGNVMPLEEEFGLRRAERPFDGALSLHLSDDFILRSFCPGMCHNQWIFGIQYAGRFVPNFPIPIRVEKRNLVGTVREDRIAFANRSVRGNGIEHHWGEDDHGCR